MTAAPIILVPGFWLGAWAWDEVAATLRADGHDVTAVTLPGLDSVETDRATISLADHIDAIVAAVRAKDSPVVLAVHSATGFSGYAASDLVPERIAAMLDGLQLFSMGFSWGGFESLVIPTHPERTRSATSWNPGGPCLRFAIGLEDPDDLIADIAAGLTRLGA